LKFIRELSRKFHALASLSLLTVLACGWPIQNAIASVETNNLNSAASEAAKLLKIGPQVDQLLELKAKGDSRTPSDGELSLQISLVKKILGGSLEIRMCTDTIDNELAEEYTAQSEMLASRNRGIELNNIANFTQSGLTGLITADLDLNGRHKAANEMDIVSGSTTLLLSSIALLQIRGGKRASASHTNMLAQILDLDPPGGQRFSPLLWEYLNSVPPGSKDGTTRREQLITRWKKSGVLTINLNEPSNLEKLAVYGPRYKPRAETIKLITNRIVMLHDVHTLVESLDSELVSLLQAVD
jgi:hypothetical protein